MDERLMKKVVGKPVPDWDMAHRLSIDEPTGPTIKDFGSVFSINSTFMDVIEPALLTKQLVLLGALMAFIGVGIGPYWYWLTAIRYPDAGGWFQDLFSICASLPFLYLLCRIVPGYILGLRYRPIRLHRGERKIYVMRSRRPVGRRDGDAVWEASWEKDAIYCLHREETPFGTFFHIRHYEVDEQGNVVRAFSIGPEWTGAAEVEDALAQWNYFCRFMKSGPSRLPKPMLFHTRNEDLRESFLFCLYGIGLQAPPLLRILMMPLILLLTGVRYAANATCRDPIWPPAIEKISVVHPSDPYEQPTGSTAVGWAKTVLAKNRGEYPNDPMAPAEDWHGEDDGKRHASDWLENPALHKTPSVIRATR